MACQFNLVLYGPVGTGKTHLAVASGRLACMRAIPAGFFTMTGLLMRLRRAKREDRLDAELRQIARARLPVIDEFGYMPIDRTVRHGRLTGFGGRLLPQRARRHDQITKRKRAAGADSAVSVGNQPPTLLKRSAHTVDTNLQKHNPHAPSRDARSSSSRWSGERLASCIALISGSGRSWPVSCLPSCEYRHRGVDRAMSYSALIPRDGLPLSHDCTICRLNASS